MTKTEAFKLIPLADFVEKECSRSLKNNESVFDKLKNIGKYTAFLKQPLELWMFIPLDEDGNVLELPIGTRIYLHSKETNLQNPLNENAINLIEKYLKAKEKVLFEGFKIGFDEQQNLHQCILPLYTDISEDGFALPIMEKEKGGEWIPSEEYPTIEHMTRGLNFDFILTQSALQQINI